MGKESWVGSDTAGSLQFNLVGRDAVFYVERGLLETQKEKLASVFRRCARWSYSTNFK